MFISVRDSYPGRDPEDHMEKSWLVDKGGVITRLPRDCLSIGKYDIFVIINTKKYQSQEQQVGGLWGLLGA